MIRILSAAVLLLAWIGNAQAYEVRAKSESTLTTAPELADLVHKIGDQVGNRIPQSEEIRVHVISQSKPRADKPDSGEILYNHRVELRKLFNGDEAPYPMGGWLVIHTSETYGIGTAEKARAELQNTIRKFFEDLKGIDPKTQAP